MIKAGIFYLKSLEVIVKLVILCNTLNSEADSVFIRE